MKARMEKTFSPTPATLRRFFGSLALLSFCFFSFACSGLQGERTATVSFSVPKNLFQKSDAAQDLDGQGATGLWLDLALKGGHSEQKTVRVDDGATVIFSAVPVGAKIWAEAAAYRIGEQGKTILYEGKSSEIVVAEGQNPLSIALKKSGPEPGPSPEPGPGPGPELEPGIKIYVSAQESNPAGSDEEGDGTREKPLTTIGAALQKMDDAQEDWTIVVLGSVSSDATIEFPEGVAAKTITVTGAADDDGNPPFVKNTSSGNSLFAVNASVPLVFKDITLEMTKTLAYGVDIQGVIFNVAEGGDLTISSGAKLVNNTTQTDLPSHGSGAVYSKGSVKIESGSLISDFRTNKAGGVYVDGGTVTMNGGKITKGHSRYGGAVYVNAGSFEMNGDSVIGGDASDACETFLYGGGVYVKNGGSFTMNGNAKISMSKICGNRGVDGGGVWCEGSFTMNGGSICGNSVGDESYQGTGGGVYVNGSSAVFTMNGGSIFENVRASKGSGVYVGSGATFKIKGDAFVADGNDVYLEDGRKITIAGALTKNYVANIVVPALADGSQSPFDNTVLVLSDGADTTLPKEFNKFTMPQNDYNGEMEYSVIQSDGTVGLIAAGDIVFTDGTAVAYSETLGLDDARKAKAASVIFYKGSACTDDGSDTRILGVGLKQKSGIAWCVSGAQGYQYRIASILCSASKSGDTYTFADGSDKDGSDNFTQIGTFLASQGSDKNDTGTAGNYPAFEWVASYSSDATNLAGTDCASGWYIPTQCELIYLFFGLKNSHVDDALELCGGTKFEWSATNTGSGNYYWSSSQCYSTLEAVERFNFNGGLLTESGGSKTFTSGVTGSSHFCAVRQF